MNKRLIILTLRNIGIGITIIAGLFTFGFIILFLNTYFGKATFSLALVGIVMLTFIAAMSHSAAKDQIEREQRRSNQIMDRLKRDYNT